MPDSILGISVKKDNHLQLKKKKKFCSQGCYHVTVRETKYNVVNVLLEEGKKKKKGSRLA